MNEFEIIDRYFKSAASRSDVLLGVGDDAALVKAPQGVPIVTALATLTSAGDRVDGAAFARALARDALNRLAAQGAAPAWITLALTLKRADADWLEAFSAALKSLLSPFDAALIGGDTTRGPTSATLVAHGTAPAVKKAADADPAAGDAIYLSGELGDAAATGKGENTWSDLRPARVNEGVAAWPLTAASADLRHSLAATLLRMLDGAGLGAEIDAARLPLSPASAKLHRRSGGARLIVDASADSELCFIVSAKNQASFEKTMSAFDTGCACIGHVVSKSGVHLR